MKEEFITFETAKIAKEKGFEVKIIGTFNGNHYYNYKGELDGDQLEIIKSICNSKPDPLIANIAAPTQSLLQRWLRETHKIDIYIQGYGFGYYPMLNNVPPANQKDILCVDRRWNLQNKENLNFETYEQALEKALLKALELIKTKNI